MRLKMAASCLWQVDAINLDQLNVDADDNELGGFFNGWACLQINRFMFNIDAWMQIYIDA